MAMTVLDDVSDFVKRRSPAAFCDDCIAGDLKLSVRQHANHKTNELANLPGFQRRIDLCSACKKTKKVIRYVAIT
ncbi:hypothetical protein [Bradyrhizobium oligotrophicum]|uniref:hypothetical protein n=1 Tax=Bradyrhizobium oligotrophicum TaxID=44255 RepID=UPI003EBCA966